MREFVERVIARLNERGKPATPLHEEWQAIRDTNSATEEYCELIGSLGLSPYEDHPKIDAVIDKLYDRLDRPLVKDLCNTANEATLPSLAELTIGIAETLDAAAQEAKLGDLLAVRLPPDQHPFAWQWGREAAHQVRREFHISNADPQGGQNFLTALDLGSMKTIGPRRAEQISGGLRLYGDRLQLAMFDELPPQQRFTAVRAAFLGWVHSAPGAHLVTTAITRDQQASRAFAAEMLAPTGYIRTRAPNRVLSDHAIDEIAQALGAPAGAVRFQAGRAGINVVESRSWG